MTSTQRIAILNQARRDNVRQHHPVSTPRDHAVDVVSILLAAVAGEAKAPAGQGMA